MLGLDRFETKINFVGSDDESEEMLVNTRSFVGQPLQTNPTEGIGLFHVKGLGLQERNSNLHEPKDGLLAVAIQAIAIDTEIIHAAVSKGPPMGDIGKIIIGAKMRGDYFDGAARSGDAMQFLHGGDNVIEMA
jgi:hypothetical protein